MNEILTSAIVGHLVGDYLLQNDWMAQNKKKRDWPCIIHCLIWTLCVMAFAGWFGWKDAGYASEQYWFRGWAFAALFLTHYAQDRTQIVRVWMTQINRQPQFAEPPLAPWSLIVVDNVWHIVTIWAVWRFVV
jgi:hypothetical protein